jgi:nucleotide-binding universal stress UspA family protein
MYKNILLPTDGLGKCVYGTCHGVILAKDLGAKITAVCVTKDLPLSDIKKFYDMETITAYSPAEVDRGVKKRAEDLHKELAEKSLEVAQRMCSDHGVPCDTVHLSNESPVDGILRAAKEKQCAMIFISTHGNPGLMATLFGSVATKIMANSKIPVLVHHCGGPS